MNSTDFLNTLSHDLGSKVRYDVLTSFCYESDVGKSVKSIPIAVLFPENSNDVSKILKIANEFNIPVTIRGGGTTIGGETVAKDSIIIDTKKMNKCFKVDKKEKIIDIGSGNTWIELYDTLNKHDLIFKVAPSSATCTIGGTVSIGGFDNHSYIHGTSTDQVEEAEVVLPNGDIVNCSQENNKEIFNHILYGNGMIGVITRIKMKVMAKYEKSYDSLFAYSNRNDALNDYFKLCEKQICDGIMFIEVFNQPIIRIENFDTPIDKSKLKGKWIKTIENQDFYINACKFMYTQRMRFRSFPFWFRYTPISLNFIDVIYPDKNYIFDMFNYSDELWKDVKKDSKFVGNLKLVLGLRVKEDSKTRPFSPIPSSIKKNDLIFGTYFGAEIATRNYDNYHQNFNCKMIKKAVDMDGMLYKYCGHVKQYARFLFKEERWNHLIEIKRKYDPNNILNRGVLFE